MTSHALDKKNIIIENILEIPFPPQSILDRTTISHLIRYETPRLIQKMPLLFQNWFTWNTKVNSGEFYQVCSGEIFIVVEFSCPKFSLIINVHVSGQRRGMNENERTFGDAHRNVLNKLVEPDTGKKASRLVFTIDLINFRPNEKSTNHTRCQKNCIIRLKYNSALYKTRHVKNRWQCPPISGSIQTTRFIC